MTLLNLLSKFSLDDIRFACGSDWRLIKDTLPSGFDLSNKSEVVRIILKLHGTSILEIKEFRELFLRTLENEKLVEISKEHKINSENSSVITIARMLAAKPWGPSSKLLRVFKKIGFDEAYLPIYRDRYKATEKVEVFTKLPKLFDYQEEVVNKLVSTINNKDRVLLQLPTGSGKTRIMMEAIQELTTQAIKPYTVLWLAHSEELLEQAIASFKGVWSSKGQYSATIHRLYGQHAPNDLLFSNSMIFAGLQKLSRLDVNSDLFLEIKQNTSLIVVDEAHKAIADTYERFITHLITKSGATLVGVTATPGRSYSLSPENRTFARFFNDNLITPELGEDPINTLQNMGVLSSVNRKVVDTNISISDAELNKPTLKRLGRLRERNYLLMNEIEVQAKAGKPTLVFSCSTEHSRLLATGLVLRGISAAFIDYTKSASSRRTVIEKFRTGEVSVLINYGILSTGFDAPEIQALVIARPTTSLILYSQMIGRGLRGPKVGGNKEVTVVDVKDNFSSYGNLDEMYNYFSGYWK